MRFRISLVFSLILLLWQQSFATAAALPATLQITVDGSTPIARDEFRRVLVERFSAWPTWTLQFGSRLTSAPCSASSPRAGLLVHLHGSDGVTQQADTMFVDCAAWPLAEWSFSSSDAVMPARDLVSHLEFALRLWQHHDPARFSALFDTGDATPRDGLCHPEMSLVKTADGQMRVVVRSGGPAYRAGLRSNDIIVHIDGRDWWEYGTFRSQLLAIDGREHTYTRPNSAIEYRAVCR